MQQRLHRGRRQLTAPAVDESRLCVACGLCCDGTLYTYAPITEGEADRLRSRLPVIRNERTGEQGLAHRCGALSDGGCGVYADRPATCRDYTCALLDKVRAGEVPLGEALAKVTIMRALADRLDVALPAGPALWERAESLEVLGDPRATTARRRHGQTLLDLKVLEHLFARDLDEGAARGWRGARGSDP